MFFVESYFIKFWNMNFYTGIIKSLMKFKIGNFIWRKKIIFAMERNFITIFKRKIVKLISFACRKRSTFLNKNNNFYRIFKSTKIFNLQNLIWLVVKAILKMKTKHKYNSDNLNFQFTYEIVCSEILFSIYPSQLYYIHWYINNKRTKWKCSLIC